MQELDRVIDQAGRMVSQLTNYPAFAMTDRREKATITRFDLLMVDQNSFIIVVMTNLNVVKNKLVKLPVDVNEPQLQLLNTLLNTSFVGKTAEELNPELMRMAEKAAGSAYGLISLVVSFAMEVLEDAGQFQRTHRRRQPHSGAQRVSGCGQGPRAFELPGSRYGAGAAPRAPWVTAIPKS